MKLLILSSLLVHLAVLPVNNKLIVFPSNKKNVFAKPVTSGLSSILNRKWEMQEIRFLYNNIPYYYKQGDDSESNINFDNDYIIFNCGGTGIYHQSNNIDYQLTWHFIEFKNNAIEFTISRFRDNSDLVVNWGNMEMLNNTIKYTEYYTHKNGQHCFGYGIRIAKDAVDQSTITTAANIGLP
jgi:hypothetical protein